MVWCWFRGKSDQDKKLCIRSNSRTFCVLAVLLLASVVMLSISPRGWSADYSEYEVKAAFLYKFVSFVEWPSQAEPEPSKPYLIGILGKDPFGNTIDDIVRQKSVRGHAIEIRRAEDETELSDCHVLFIAASEQSRFKDVLTHFKGANILTVGESDDAAESGAVMSLYTINGRVRFEVNIDAAKAASLKISSDLLDVAIVVEDDENAKEGNRG